MKLGTATRVSAGFRNLLLATDLSPVSETALQWAKALAKHYGSELYVSHVVSPGETALVPPEYWGTSQEMIEEAAAQDMQDLDAHLAGVPHKTVIQRGGVWECLSADIKDLRIDLLVMGSHGREGFARLMLGSVAEETFRRAPCPVFTIGPHVAAPGEEVAFERILFATDFGPESVAAAQVAVQLAEEFGSRLTLLHVMNEEDFDLPADPQVLLKSRTQRLRHVIPAGAELRQEPQFLVEFGKTGEQILRTAEEIKAELVVLGAKAAGQMGSGVHFGSPAAHQVVSAAVCPVLTVHA